ncbi:tungsten formylmethanofuran dehydrogenase [Chryseobacterium shigense]|uniref:Propionate 3-nitronate monooxygenase n=1 Tax=Chryseobacterium shigense TaxID=297244 RepID=A0A1N7I9B0_9FLAO|nr:nitronate monooxygenase [Chryseobacterium shigense]PQA96886.1 tungsten formylmethanofuran dehydrogenase [Chryseobacterium shigense]SIS33675.1 nitronate monooxygenase [Chryseobacterium shigense]
MFWPDTISKILQIKYPVIQAPMSGVSTPQMTAAAANAACLGSLALADLSADESVKLIRETRKLTDQPFAVNIFVHHIPEMTQALKGKFVEVKQFITQLAKENNMEVTLPDLQDIKVNSYHEQVDAIIKEGCKILSFTFGNLDENSIQKLKENEVILIGTCTSVEEALALEKSGIDLICVQGIEAGGHRGTFDTENIPLIGGMSLLSEVYEQVRVPLIYAGGLYNGRTLKAARELGAQAFQVGSILLASQESNLQPFEKERLKNISEKDIVLTKSFSGRFARGLTNKYIQTLEASDFILPYPYQNKLTNELRRVSKTLNNTDFVSIWLGQSIHDYSLLSTGEILKKLILDVQ